MKKALLLDIYLKSLTQSTKRPEDERHLSFDVSSFNQREFELAANVEDGSNANSVVTLSSIGSFVHFYVPYPVELTIGPSLIVPNFTGIFILSSALTQLKIRNLATDRSVVCSVVFS